MKKGITYRFGKFVTSRPKTSASIAAVVFAIWFGAGPLFSYLDARKQSAKEATYKANAARVVAQMKEAQIKKEAELAAMTPEQRAGVAKQEAVAAAERERVADAARRAEIALKEAATKKERDFQRVLQTGAAIKASMHNPSSFQLESAVLMADGTACFEFRGTNAFNAIILNQKAYSPEFKERDWTRHCGGKSGMNMTHIRSVL